MKVGNKRCKCPTCGEYFSSVGGFDEHRVGKYGVPGDRRCLVDSEMRSAGLNKTSEGYWILPIKESDKERLNALRNKSLQN